MGILFKLFLLLYITVVINNQTACTIDCIKMKNPNRGENVFLYPQTHLRYKVGGARKFTILSFCKFLASKPPRIKKGYLKTVIS